MAGLVANSRDFVPFCSMNQCLFNANGPYRFGHLRKIKKNVAWRNLIDGHDGTDDRFDHIPICTADGLLGDYSADDFMDFNLTTLSHGE
jgi:hypothetical protein